MDSRFHSLALGRYLNFEARTDGLIAVGDSSPSVRLYSLLYADTAGTLTLENLDDGEEGKIVILMNLGAGDVQYSGGSFLAVDSSVVAQNQASILIQHDNVWYELARKELASQKVVTAAAGDATPSVKGAEVLVFDSLGAITVTSLDDAYEGQVLKVLNLSSNVTLNSSCVIQTSGGDFILTASDAVSLVYVKSNWFALREAYTGANPA